MYKAFNSSKNYGFEEYYRKNKSTYFVHHDLLYGLPFADGAVPNIFTSHFLEHLTRTEAEALMADCYRVLRKGGMIRICVPDLDVAVQKISSALVAYREGDVRLIVEYVTSSQSDYLGPYSFHKWMYNFGEMRDLLDEYGFRNITQQCFKRGDIPDVELLDTRRGLYVEARK
ncbi:MAG TPA: methyltransferase domain-containing protein [Rhodothermales bacterium]|nr:methyltransferase domain-containing protein [Rhodothermales bacterium]